MPQHLEIPVLVGRVDGPLELVAESLGEDLLNWDVKLLAEHDGQTRINIVLGTISNSRHVEKKKTERKTYKLGCAQCNRLILLLICFLGNQSLNLSVELLNVCLALLNSVV